MFAKKTLKKKRLFFSVKQAFMLHRQDYCIFNRDFTDGCRLSGVGGSSSCKGFEYAYLGNIIKNGPSSVFYKYSSGKQISRVVFVKVDFYLHRVFLTVVNPIFFPFSIYCWHCPAKLWFNKIIF